jgi:hypothetical protein
LLQTESTLSSGFFLKKKATFQCSQEAYVYSENAQKSRPVRARCSTRSKSNPVPRRSAQLLKKQQ